MSAWTHVAAIFRVDCGWPGDERLDFRSIFGHEHIGGSRNKVYFDTADTEVELEMSVWENPDMNCCDRYTVSVFGDVRYFTDVEQIREWFRECCAAVRIRQAVITIDSEDGTHIVERKGFEYDE